MAVKPEAGLYKRLKENLPEAHITRIESRVNLGIPDCLIALNKDKFVMVELKVVKRGKKVALSPHQVAFHLKHASLGCPTYIMVQYHPAGTTTALKADLLLYKGAQAEELLHLGVECTPFAKWSLSHVHWHMVRHALTE
jgi:Holliday junction resolvase